VFTGLGEDLLVPETIDATTLGRVAAGNPVNPEVDVSAKDVEKLVRTP
jgi:riboflavin synthase alpha subunit